ncbi:MAG: hypothetical protein NT029_20920 [Armatimonadetes bacterium]|nr:hypothetical protein [Armatimonadota bacterium]
MDGAWPLAMLTGSPLQWAALAAIVVAIFAPKLIPPLVRIVTGLLLQRYVGVAPPPRRKQSATAVPAVEVLPPEKPTPALRRGADRPVRARPKARPVASLAGAVAFVGLVVAVLSWLLLRVR